MGTVERQIKIAQRRLWFNRWLRQWGWALAAAIVAWLIAWILDRLFALRLPMDWFAYGGLAASVVASIVWLVLTREPRLAAAAALDEAAGFKERLATGIQLPVASEDPFEQAVMADAERVVAGLSARRFIRLRWAGSLSISSMILAVALLSLLLPEFDILGKDEARAQAQGRQVRLANVQATVAKPVNVLQKIVDEHPELGLEQQTKDLVDMTKRPGDVDPDLLRRDTLKQIDRVQKALEKEIASDRFKALAETKKRLAQLGKASAKNTKMGKLMQSLATGQLDQAQEAVKEMKESLAKRRQEGKMDPEKLKEMQKQLEDLEKRLQDLSKDNQSEQELQNAGCSQAEAKRILDTLAKKDPKQIQQLAKQLSQRLQQQGMSQQQALQQAQKMLQQMQQRQQGCKQCQNMGAKMGQAAQQIGQGNLQGAESELGEAGEMLSDMEMLDQAMNNLESQSSQLNDARDEMNQQEPQPCPHCHGSGYLDDGSPCPYCNGSGQQGPNGGGSGGQGKDKGGNGAGSGISNNPVNTQRDPDMPYDRAKAETKITPGGGIIGQRFVKGRRLTGQTTVEMQEAASAAEVEASDALDRDRIPRQYRKGVRNYFDRLGTDYDASKPKSSGEAKGETGEAAQKGEASEGEGASSSDSGEAQGEQSSGGEGASASGGSGSSSETPASGS